MTDGDSRPPGFQQLLRKLIITGVDALQNRAEILQVELREEENRAIELFIWAALVGFFSFLFVVIFTATIILLFPENLRIYAAGGFSLLYLVAAVLALLNLKALVRNASAPFSDSMTELKKDREWLESLK